MVDTSFPQPSTMGKKSRNPNKKALEVSSGVSSSMSASFPVPSSASPSAATAAAPGYPSDGPSQDECNSFQTSSASLQAKLDRLTSLILDNDRASFVAEFVPLDLSPADSAAYLADLTTAEEAQGQWRNLAAEISALAAGKGVQKIEGDQSATAIFYFEHPLFVGCDREVTFVCRGGDWRAQG